MALFDGFFDSFYNEETGEYDRKYGNGSDDFSEYFDQMTGSGVCVHKNPDSFKVRLEDGAAVVSPGYLFIQGYWLKNDGEYALELTGGGTIAIKAYLNLGKRMIELLAVPAAASYPDALVLALIDTAAGTVEDTRYNTGICGVIDAPGALSEKIEYALNYIDTQADARLEQIEKTMADQEKKLDAAIRDVEGEAAKMQPAPVGTVRFSAGNIQAGWLKCDGDFVSRAEYPELVEQLGKLTIGTRSFTEIAGGRIPRDISNGVLHNGRMWVYSNSSKKLYGVSLSSGDIKEMPVTGADKLNSMPIATFPIYLSIIDSALFIAQRWSMASVENIALYYSYNFSDTLSSLSVSEMKEMIKYDVLRKSERTALYVVKNDGKYMMSDWYGTYHYATSGEFPAFRVAAWENGDTYIPRGDKNGNSPSTIRTDVALGWNWFYTAKWMDKKNEDAARGLYGFNRKNDNELVFWHLNRNTLFSSTYPISVPKNPYYLGFGANDQSHTEIEPDDYFDTMSLVGNWDFMIEYIVKSGVFTIQFVKSINSENDMRYEKLSLESLKLPTASKVFGDAAVYLEDRELWLFFVGTGFVFTKDLAAPQVYGFLDTRDVLGTIIELGYVEYDQATGRVCILGQDSSHTPRLGVMTLENVYDPSGDGAYLPTLSMSGIPGYIKAKELET